MRHSIAGHFVAIVVAALAIAATATAQTAATCGDVDASGVVGATDALWLLKKAVGQDLQMHCPSCPPSLAGNPRATSDLCGDLDGSGAIGATDALLLLKKAVGQEVTLECPTCGATTTTTLVVPESCGNGVVDGSEECERYAGCDNATERCTASCTCEPIPASEPSSQDLIATALELGEIDYPTSLLYRTWALFGAQDLPEQYFGAGSIGEDQGLFEELEEMDGQLPAEIDAAIQSYVVRPTDPSSIFSQEPVASLIVGADAASAPTVGCAKGQGGAADWGYSETEHFVVWSCNLGFCFSGKSFDTSCRTDTDCDSTAGAGDGDCAAIDDADRRLVAGIVAEQAYDAMMAESLPEPRKDDLAIGPAPQDRIDIYVLRTNECYERNGSCVTIKGLAAAPPTTPCDRKRTALTQSAFMILSVSRVPMSIPAPNEDSPFRADVVHELFHVFQHGMNAEVMGYECGQKETKNNGRRSWMTEATAEWAPFVFFPVDDQARRTRMLELFQEERDPSLHGLQTTGELREYQSALYFQFLEQHAGTPAPGLDLWKTSQNVRTIEGFDRHLDGIVFFEQYFRDFAVRDLNRELPGNPITPMFSDLDPARPSGIFPATLEPAFTLFPFLELVEAPIAIAPLFFQSEYYKVDDSVRWVRLDTGGLSNGANLTLDVIELIGGQWKRRKIDGSIYEFCREDEGRDVDQFYVVLANHDLRADGGIEGNMIVEAAMSCPGGWSGTIQLKRTLSEHSEVTDGGTTITDRYEREVHRWSIQGSKEVLPPGYPPGFEVDEIDARWHGSFSRFNTVVYIPQMCTGSTVYTVEAGSNTDSGAAKFQAAPYGGGAYGFSPYSLGSEFAVPIEIAYDTCDGKRGTATGEVTVGEPIGMLAMVEDLMMLQAPTGGETKWSGTHKLVDEEQNLPGGSSFLKVTVDWDLSRDPER